MGSRTVLTAAQRELLDKIVCAEVQPDDGGFPDMRTVNALMRKGLIEVKPIEGASFIDRMMAASGCTQIIPTDAGRAVIACLGPSPTSPGAQEDRSDG